MNIIIVCGGKSVEEQISIITAIKVYKSLLSSNEYHPYLVYQDPNDFNFYGGQGLLNLENYADKHRFKKGRFIKNKTVNYFKMGHKKIFFDIVFPVVHGANTEDGTMASFFITQGFPTLSPSLSASSICQDKILFKDLIKSMKIKTCKSKSLSYQEYQNDDFKIDKILSGLKYPLILKPYDLGSSIGIGFASSKEEINEELNKCFTYSDHLLIEEYVSNKEELNIALIKDEKDRYHFSNVERIKTLDDSYYSYEDKYLDGKIIKEVPYNPSENELNKLQDICISVYEKLKLSGVVRYDFIKSEDDIYLNEVNTIPGNYAINLYLGKGYSIKTLIDIYIKSNIKKIQEITKPLNHDNRISELSKSNKLKLK